MLSATYNNIYAPVFSFITVLTRVIIRSMIQINISRGELEMKSFVTLS